MAFPNPPVPNQEHTHSNGLTYIYSDTDKAWNLKYEAATNTASLPLVSPSSRYLPSAGASLPDSGGLLTQSDYNQWAFNALTQVDSNSRVDSGEDPPDPADTNQLWYKPSTGSLYVYYNDGTSAQWVEISPSVNLDGYATEDYVQDQIKDFATQQDVEDGDTSTFDQLTVDYQAGDDALHRQIVEIEEELEALMPSVERGEWDFSLDVDPGANGENQGLYSMLRVFTQADKDAAEEACTQTYADCMVANQGDPVAQGQCNTDYTLCSNAVPNAGSSQTTNDFALTEVLRFATYDANNESHNWILNVAVGTYINVFNEDNDDYALYQVTDVQGMWYEGRSDVTVDVVSAKGTATGRARFKVFTLEDDSGVNLTNYVQKSGDTMTGPLILDAPKDKTLLRMSKNGVTEIEFNNHEEGLWIHADTAFKIVGYRNGALSQMLKVYKDDIGNDDPADDKPGGIRISNMRDPASDLDGVNKSYMEDYVTSYYSGFTGEYLRLDGGVMSGNLVMNGAGFYTDAIIKSTRTSGYALQVYDAENDSNPAFIHSNGNIRGASGTFTSDVEIRGTTTFKGATHFEANLNFEGAWIGGNLGFHRAGKGVRFYGDDKSTHFADITRQGIVLENKMYADNLWTLKVQDASDANSKTLIYADYSSGLILKEVGELDVKGNLTFTGGGTIDATSGDPVLSGRASLDIRTAADYPVVISSGSGYKKVLSIYGYDGNEDDNRAEVAYINADGNAHFKTVYSDGEELVPKSYVDDQIAALRAELGI